MEDDSNSEQRFTITPKGMWILLSSEILERYGVRDEILGELWESLESACVKMLARSDPDGEFPALIFDGRGGHVVSAGLSEDDCE